MKKITAVQLRIDLPCMENWEAMTPDAQGRFCAVCERSVVDFGQMSDSELLDYFLHYKGERLCGRIQKMRLEQPIQAPKKHQNLAAAVLSGALLLGASGCNGWGEKEPHLAGTVAASISVTFNGKVSDGKKGMDKAQVAFVDANGNTIETAETNENGDFIVSIYEYTDWFGLVCRVQKEGVGEQEYKVDSTFLDKNLTLVLK